MPPWPHHCTPLTPGSSANTRFSMALRVYMCYPAAATHLRQIGKNIPKSVSLTMPRAFFDRRRLFGDLSVCMSVSVCLSLLSLCLSVCVSLSSLLYVAFFSVFLSLCFFLFLSVSVSLSLSLCLSLSQSLSVYLPLSV